MKLRGRRDGNHREIVGALRQCGIFVLDLANVGNGCPDLLTAFGHTIKLLEIKDGRLPPSKRRLTELEQDFFDRCPGPCHIVCSVEDALAVWGIAG